MFRFLMQGSKGGIVLVSLIGFLGGACSAGVIALINVSLHNTATSPVILCSGFLLLVTVKILASTFSQQFLFRLSQRTILGMSVSLSREIARSSLRQLEKSGTPKIMAVLTDDIHTLGGAIQAVPSLMVNVAVLVACSIYLAVLSVKAFALLVVLALLGVLLYRVMLKQTQVTLNIVREKRDTLFADFRQLTEGIKELRINRARRNDLFDNHLSKTIEELNFHAVKAIRRFVWTDALSQLVFYSVLGSFLFAFPFLTQVPAATLTGYVFASLYVMGPVWGVIYALPGLQKGQIALERIEKFRSDLSIEPEPVGLQRNTFRSFENLQIQDVAFSYGQSNSSDEGDAEFTLGPINFNLSPGELVFVIGGNGCGKSTFVKLLCGLYTPRSGKILLDGHPVTDNDREEYRQNFSVVFSDFFLFDSILADSEASEERTQEYMAMLQLDKKVSINNGRLSTTALSQGQRRRLALLNAYLEDRPIYVFDEWAADQDPSYKEVFYKTLLPELRARGKGIVVITHDDRYFHLGDRVVTLDYGKVVEDAPTASLVI